MNKKRISLSNFIINNFYLPKLIIISLFLPKNVNYISILIIIILLFLIYLLINRYIKINYSILFLLLCMLWNINIIFIDEINIYFILSIIIILSYLYVKDSIKIDITIMYIVLLLIFNYVFLNNYYINSIFGISSLLLASFIYNDNISTSNVFKVNMIYSIFLSILTIIYYKTNSFYVIIISVLIFNILSKKIEKLIINF